jgi:conjugative transposon TraJ protein
VDDEAYDEKLSELGIRHVGQIVSMWWERAMFGIKTWFRELMQDFFELLFNAAALTIDTLRTFFLVVLAILGPLSFALSVYDGFQSTLTNWISRYISVYLWLPIADLFSAILSKIRALMLQQDITLLQDPSYSPDGANGMYIIFLIIGIIGYFSIPTVSEWVIQAGGGASGGLGGINKAGSFTTGVAGGLAGNAIGRTVNRKGAGSSDGGVTGGQNLATHGGS